MIPKPRLRISLKSVLDLLASLSMLLVSIGLAWVYLIRPSTTESAKKELEIPKDPVSMASVPVIGSGSSRLVVMEFSDFECPFCGKFAREVWPTINDEYVAPGRAQFAFRNLPLETIHKRAKPAARLSVCAGRQAQFWPMHDALFQQPLSLDDASLSAKAQRLNLDDAMLRECLASTAEELVVQDINAAKGLNVRYTPSFFFGERVDRDRVKVLKTLSGYQSLPAFKQVIEETEAQIKLASCGVLARILGRCTAT